MADAERRPPRDALAALRIDRDAPPPPRRGRGILVALALAAAFGAASLLAWRLTVGGTPVVRIAYAERTGAAAAPAAEVLTGSGYVVTGERYISLGVRVPSRIEDYLV